MPVVLEFAEFDGAASCGSAASAYFEDNGIGLWGGATAGSVASAEFSDVSLLLYGSAACGSTLSSEFGEDIVLSLGEFYGSASVGAWCKGRVFLDPYVPGLSRYLPEGRSS
jgi:hypothetical protein